VRERWVGPLVVALILGGVLLILALNLNLNSKIDKRSDLREAPAPERVGGPPAGFREYPIGDEVERNQMRIAAVYLPPIQMEGMDDPASSSLIHLEADIHATAGNRNGFAQDEFVPYLVVRYAIVAEKTAADGKSGGLIRGTMMPMVARDGLHYGATIDMPAAGRYKLTYSVDPPSAGGLGRHADAATGVEPWWKPFEVSFDWDYPGPPKAQP
jgi:uncharacterized protein involved in high-affinity Fe2+ transport